MKINDAALCLYSSGLLAGFQATITGVVVPTIKATSDPLPGFKRMYKNGSKIAISLIVVTSGLGLKCFTKTEDVRYLLLAGTELLIPIYTFLIVPTNKELFGIKDGKYLEEDGEEDRVRKLITKWDKLHYGRVALAMLGFAINAWIVCKKVKH